MKTLIIGAGDFALMAAHAFADDRAGFTPIAYVVEHEYFDKADPRARPLKFLDDLPETFTPSEHAFFVAITFARLNAVRTRLYQQMLDWGYTPATYVSPLANVKDAQGWGAHCFIQEGNNLQFGVELGDNVILWAGNHIGHGTKIGDHTYISSHVVISGDCHIGTSCFVGVNASIAHGVTIGDGCIIGMGTVITRDIPDGSVVSRAADRPVEGLKASEVDL